MAYRQSLERVGLNLISPLMLASGARYPPSYRSIEIKILARIPWQSLERKGLTGKVLSVWELTVAFPCFFGA